MSTTMLVLLRTLAENLDDDGLFVTGTATSGTSATLVDTTEPGLYYSSGDANLFNRWFVYNELSGAIGRVTVGGLTGSSGTLALTGGEFGAEGTGTAAVSTTTAGGTGTLTDTRVSWVTNQWVGALCTCNTKVMTVTSNTAQTLTSTTDWDADPGDAAAWTLLGVCPYILTRDNPVILKKAINRTLESTYEPSFFPLSLHIVGNDCNDMEASTVATDYTDNTTDTGSLAAESTIVFNGGQSLKVTCDDSTAAEYASLDSALGVQENQSLYAAVMCYVTSGDSATFRVYDVTGPATIEDMTSDEPSWVELVSQFSTPSDCEQIDVHMISDAVDDVTYWDDLQIWRGGESLYPCPSWLTRSGQMIDVRAFPQGTGGPASDNDYRSNERASTPLDWHIEGEDTRGNDQFHLAVTAGSGRPYIYALRPMAALSSDTATTNADRDTVLDLAADLVRDPVEGNKRLRTAATARLIAPREKSQIRFGVRIG